MKGLGLRKPLPLKEGDEIECVALESKSTKQIKFGIHCAGKLEDGRIVLFDKESGLSKAIKPRDRVKGTVLVSKPNYVLIVPDKIVEQAPEIDKNQVKGVSKWNHSLIISIRREKEKQKSPDLDRALKLISKALYGEKTHYILELVQNAEDEDASGISFIIYENQIKVWNNGEPFNSEDVENICSVRSGKRNKIGFFGIGFKSVFNITNRPRIVSGDYNFLIDDFIYPSPCDIEPLSDFDPKRGAWFILPYESSEHTPESLEESMKEIDERVLLFLQNVKEIAFANVVSRSSWYLERKELEGDIVSLFNSSTGVCTSWKIFTKDLNVPKKFHVKEELRQKPEVTRIAVAFPLPSNGETKDVTSEPIYCYLPTKKRTDMPFLIQGDFDPTVGRENIKDNDWNKWLLLQVGELVVESCQKLRDQGISHDLLYNYIPLNEEVKEPILRDVYEVIRSNLEKCAIAPTEDGRWVTPPNVIIDTSQGDLKSLIGNDIRKLKGEEVGYLSSKVGERGRLILLELGAQEITTNELIDFLQMDELLRDRALKGAQWFLRLYVYLGKEFYKDKMVSERLTYETQLSKLKSSRIILSARNELLAIDDPKKPDAVIFYPHRMNLNEEYRAFSEGYVDFVHHYFQKATILRKKKVNTPLETLRDKAKEFLDFLGVRLYYNDYTIINDIICRLLEHPEKISDEAIVRYTDFVRENVDRYLSLAKSKYQTGKNEQEISQGLGEKLTVEVFYFENGRKTEGFAKVSETYLSEPFGDSSMERLFDGVQNVFFLSDIYVKDGNAKKWSEFFQRVGIWTCPRIIKIKGEQIRYGDPDYSWVPFQGYYGEHILEGNWVGPELKDLFVFAESLDREARLARFKLLWNVLNENWNKTYRQVESCSYVWTPISVPRREKIKRTSFLNQLLKFSWVLASDGSLCQPTKLFRSTKRNRLLLGNLVKFLAFEGNQSFMRALNITEKPAKQEVMKHLNQLRLQGVTYTKETLEKFRTIYMFLIELPEKPTEIEIEQMQRIRNECEHKELVYIPRKDKEWWSPSKTFWKDHNQIFGKMRGYLSPFYNPDMFPIFEKFGMKEAADLKNCINILKEISEVKEVTDMIRAILNSVYLECARLLALNEYPEEITESFSNLNLLARARSGKYGFSNVKDLVFADDEQLSNIFAEDLRILWLGCAYSEVSKLLEALSIEPLSSFVEVEVSPIDVIDVPLSMVETVREWKHYLDLWTKFKKPKLYTTFIDGLEKLGKIQILEAQEIRLKYKLEAKSVITKSLTRDVYYDKKQNKLYLNASLDAYSPKIASELCRIFVGGEALKEPVLALLSTGDDDKKRIEVFEQFGIPKEGLPRLIMERIEPKQIEEIEEDTIKSATEKLKPTETEEEGPESIKITIPQRIFSLGPLLINPDDYTPSEIKELEVSLPSNSSESAEPLTRVVRAKHKTHPPTRAGARRRTIKVTMSPQLPEDVAFELVKKFEESEKRITDDSPRDQKNVGYDISSSDGISKRFIDIKSSKYDDLVITIQRSEWRKAELEGDNYYLYIVTGLRAGGTPTLQIIQNPIKYLKPDITSRINISNWVHAVRFEISYSKIDETQP